MPNVGCLALPLTIVENICFGVAMFLYLTLVAIYLMLPYKKIILNTQSINDLIYNTLLLHIQQF